MPHLHAHRFRAVCTMLLVAVAATSCCGIYKKSDESDIEALALLEKYRENTTKEWMSQNGVTEATYNEARAAIERFVEAKKREVNQKGGWLTLLFGWLPGTGGYYVDLDRESLGYTEEGNANSSPARKVDRVFKLEEMKALDVEWAIVLAKILKEIQDLKKCRSAAAKDLGERLDAAKWPDLYGEDR